MQNVFAVIFRNSEGLPETVQGYTVIADMFKTIVLNSYDATQIIPTSEVIAIVKL